MRRCWPRCFEGLVDRKTCLTPKSGCLVCREKSGSAPKTVGSAIADRAAPNSGRCVAGRIVRLTRRCWPRCFEGLVDRKTCLTPKSGCLVRPGSSSEIRGPSEQAAAQGQLAAPDQEFVSLPIVTWSSRHPICINRPVPLPVAGPHSPSYGQSSEVALDDRNACPTTRC